MKLGVFSICMPEYGLQESVGLLKDTGFDAVEWRVAEIPEKKPDVIPYDRRYWIWNKSTVDIKRIGEIAPDLRGMCDDAGLDITGFTTYLAPDMIPQIIPVLEAARATGVKQVRLFPRSYVYDAPQKPYYETFNQTREDIRRLEGLAGEYGVKIVFEIHHDTIFAGASASMRLVEGTDPARIGLIVDPGNMVKEGFENVVVLKTFSKIFAPGFRLGWIFGPQEVLDKIYVCKQALDLCPPVLNQYIAAEFMGSGALDRNLAKSIAYYRDKRDYMLSLLERHMPSGVSWTHPEGGLFLFLTLPEGIDTVQLYERALAAGVAYVAGSFFYIDGSRRNTMRLNFSFLDKSRMEEGVRLLASVIRD